jgi:hypothetical protein
MTSKARLCTRNSSVAALIVIVLSALIGVPGDAAAAAAALKGKGTYFVKRTLMPLADGGAVLHTTASTVASSDSSDGGVLFGECAGLAHIDGDGKAKGRIYCNFTEGGKDVFVVEADIGIEGGDVRIIGGSGKWSGASGTGMLKRIGEDGGTGTYLYEFNISAP